MSKLALFIRHKALPGKRDALRSIWEKHVKLRAEANLAHEAYFFCYDTQDPDGVSVFQLYDSSASLDAFLAGAWYPEYLREASTVVASPPELTTASLVWAKPAHAS